MCVIGRMEYSAAVMLFLPVSAALASIPKFNGRNVAVADWAERLQGTACLYKVPAEHGAECWAHWRLVLTRQCFSYQWQKEVP